MEQARMTTTFDNIDHNVINFSGGKDSTAMLLLAIERDTPDLSVVFADTGIERERKYFDIACERIDNAYRQAPLFPVQIVKPTPTGDLFEEVA